MRKKHLLPIIIAAAMTLAFSGAAFAGSVSGVIQYGGGAAKAKEFSVNKDKKVCGNNPIFDHSLLVKDGGVSWAVVSIKGAKGGKWTKAMKKAVIDQNGCVYNPRVVVMKAGTKLTVKNSDKILHTAHGYFAATFNVALPGGGANQKRQLSRPGIVQIRCDRHGWMNAFVRVDRHPFHAVTDAEGRFKIEGVPPGTYTLEVWHERSGSKTQEIAVKEKQVTRVELTFVE